MGQRASVPKKRKKKKYSNETLLKLDEQIALMKQDLVLTKQMGEVQSRTAENEIYELEMELYQKKLQLHRKGENAKQCLSFWEYVEVVNTVLHKDSSANSDSGGDMTWAQYRARLKAEEEEKKRKSSALMNNFRKNFNIYSFFEAFLLRRLHIAMLLKHQRVAQSKVWNDIIMFMFNKAPGMKRRVKTVNEKYSTLQPKSNETMREMRRLQEKKLKLYERMVINLEEQIREEGYETSSLDRDEKVVDEKAAPHDLVRSVTVDITQSASDVANETAKYYQKGRYAVESDEMSFRSFSSRKSRASKRRESDSPSSSVADPRWRKSSASKLSKVNQRGRDGSLRSQRSRSGRSPSFDPPTHSSSKGDNGTIPSHSITDDDIEQFLYPNKIRTFRRSKASPELPSELEFGNGAAPVHDDEVSSIGSGSMRVKHISEDYKRLAEIKAKKKELDTSIKTMGTPGEECEEAIEQ